MIITPLQNKISFTSGKSTLFTDFDGTFLPQPLDDVYNGTPPMRQEAVSKINKYFSQIQDFITRKKGNFDIVITTGRRLDWHRMKGFVPFLGEIKDFGIVFPKIKRLITTDGGDIHEFLPDGNVSRVPNADKREMITRLSGWDNEKIKQALDIVSEETGTKYSFVNPKGSYRLSIKLDDESKLEVFHEKLREKLGADVKFKSKISYVKDYSGDLSYVQTRGIKMEPVVEGSKLHKDFDVKAAIKNAIKNDDFVVVAGDASNDKEMLNIFRYINNDGAIPQLAEEITPGIAAKAKPEIDKLPVKILFVRPKPEETKKLPLLEFMKKLEEYFPEKVQIVEQTFPGERNFFLEAVENAVNSHKFKTPPQVPQPPQPPKGRFWRYVIIGGVVLAAGAIVIKKIFFPPKSENNPDKNTQAKTYQFFA